MARRPTDPEYGENTEIYNILVIGQSQSGKSTLIEAIRKYADPNCTIHHKKIGNGSQSFTTEVTTEHVFTNLPKYRIVEKKTGKPIRIAEFFANPDKYEEERNRMEGISMEAVVKEDAKVCHFQIFDTPGLDDTKGTDVRHIRKILSDIRAAREIHLVIIMVNSQTHISPGLQDALRTYKNVFSTMRDIMMFLHTKVPNEHQTPEDTEYWPAVQERIKLLDGIMNQKIPHFIINNRLNERRPVHNCCNYNKILSILQLATFNIPVKVDDMPLHKTEKMIRVDEIVIQHYKALFEAEDRTCKQLDIAYQLKTRIDDAQRSIEELRSFIATHDTDRLVLIHQDRFDENWRYLHLRDTIHFEYKSQPYKIIHKDVLMFSVKIENEVGGEGHDSWKVDIKRNPFEFGMYHVKLYTREREKYRRQISIRKTQLIVLENELQSLQEQQKLRMQQLRDSNRNSGSSFAVGAILDPMSEEAIAGIMSRRARYARILDRISHTTLTWGMYRALDDAKAYEGDIPS
ncbi:hypothetical protein BGZ46_001820, partial [Entomortierella lignicola]